MARGAVAVAAESGRAAERKGLRAQGLPGLSGRSVRGMRPDRSAGPEPLRRLRCRFSDV